MKLERALRGIAGVFVLITVSLAHFHSSWWLLFTAIVGFNLFQSAFSNWCPMKSVLQWLGLQSCEKEIEALRKGLER
ncbi:MAG: hypothetical protein A2Z86_00360 [Candidatus Glassbacteria bacterium GWA2_58_10]|uniref:Inner membrane protein YgaP-like transmembrane domain-containing protein n=1 Tax=Candidatus Glassbacteria bacterium GWA2_58_10 TaxID=1817865 RepID=A0A1F5YEQ8_9BACT|nr:MAG: hypothetical protein A2Z86_00360 [Candidatus Glassbacteria bacterium GWA2_58_10]